MTKQKILNNITECGEQSMSHTPIIELPIYEELVEAGVLRIVETSNDDLYVLTTVKLAMCPFCGGLPKVVRGKDYWWWVECNPNVPMLDIECGGTIAPQLMLIDAVHVWNGDRQPAITAEVPAMPEPQLKLVK